MNIPMNIKKHLPNARTAEIATAIILPVPYALYKGGEYAVRKVREHRERNAEITEAQPAEA